MQAWAIHVTLGQFYGHRGNTPFLIAGVHKNEYTFLSSIMVTVDKFLRLNSQSRDGFHLSFLHQPTVTAIYRIKLARSSTLGVRNLTIIEHHCQYL